MKIFHCLANHHRRINYVEEFEIDEGVVRGNEDLRKGAKTFFNKLYSEDFKWNPSWMA